MDAHPPSHVRPPGKTTWILLGLVWAAAAVLVGGLLGTAALADSARPCGLGCIRGGLDDLVALAAFLLAAFGLAQASSFLDWRSLGPGHVTGQRIQSGIRLTFVGAASMFFVGESGDYPEFVLPWLVTLAFIGLDVGILLASGRFRRALMRTKGGPVVLQAM